MARGEFSARCRRFVAAYVESGGGFGGGIGF